MESKAEHRLDARSLLRTCAPSQRWRAATWRNWCFRYLLVSSCIAGAAGCSIFIPTGIAPEHLAGLAKQERFRGLRGSKSEPAAGAIANPPAKTVRFDGHEIVLGEAKPQTMAVDQLATAVERLIGEQRWQSATSLLKLHRETTERLLTERWATHSDQEVMQLAAMVLDSRGGTGAASWSALLELANRSGIEALRYQQSRNGFALNLQTAEPSNEEADKLLQASLEVAHPLVRVDALRLLGLRELVAGRHAWAESQFRQAIDTAVSAGQPSMAAELWLTVSETVARDGRLEDARQAWVTAINHEIAIADPHGPLDVNFWLLAEETRPHIVDWPRQVSEAFKPYLTRIGCSEFPGDSQMPLWAGIALAQYGRGELQTALVNYKKAETMATGDNVHWLRIAQAQCLAGMGQAPSAAAILSGPATSSNPTVAAAATAAMGSIKLKSGAYQQGAHLLHKALVQAQGVDWPSRNQAQADLALAQLILGETDSGLAALREAQQLLEQAGDRHALIQSLENELRLLEHEQRLQETGDVRARMQKHEQLESRLEV